MTSATTRLIDRYSASADESDTEACFFDFHEIGDPPIVIKYSLIDRRVSTQNPQSASQNASSMKEGSKDMKIPCPGLALIY